MKSYLCSTLFVTIFLFPACLYGQPEDYYAKDSILRSGVKLVDRGHILNSMYCQIEEGENDIVYTPYQISEYGFKGGLTYRSFEVTLDGQKNRFFFERLVNGKLCLYYLKLKGGIEKFYLLNADSSDLIEIPLKRDEYSVVFNRLIIDCPSSLNNVPLVRIKKNNLKRYIGDYNVCYDRPFPKIKYGFSIGTVASRLSVVDDKSIYAIPDYNFLWSMSLGISMDIPLKASNFSIHPEAFFKKIRMSDPFYTTTANDLVNNYSTLSFPLLFRYTMSSNNISPFFQIGPVYSRAIKNNSILYEYEAVNNNIYINIINSQVLQDNLGGYSAGGGIILKKRLFAEVQYCRLYNLEQENKCLNFSEISFCIGQLF